jgi:uncharacterized protein
MFGPYEIEHEGRRYFGNVTLKELHFFQHGGEFHLLDVEGMVPHQISEALYRSIAGGSYHPGGLVPEERMKILRDLHLVVGEGDGPDGMPAAVPSADAAVPAGPHEGASGDGSAKASESGIGNIALLVAQECNMSCVYCYGQGGGYGGGGMMSEETAFRAVDWLMANSKKTERVNISFFGGEPLLNFPLIRKVVEYAKNAAQAKGKKVTFGITTNATLLTDDIISFMSLEKINPLVSFDGPPEIQNRQRPLRDGSGSYDTVRANIRKLREAYPRLAARAIAYGDADPLAIEAGMREVGLTSCSVGASSPVILAMPKGATSPEDRAERAIGPMIALRRKEGDDLLRAIKDRQVEENGIAGFLQTLISRKKRYFGCGVGKGMAGISVSGDIFPCHRFVGQEDAKMGHIDSDHPEGLNEYHRAVVLNLPGCRSCWARYFCGGGCFYHNKAHTGDMHRPGSSFCEEMKATVEIAISICLQMDEGDREFLQTAYEDRSEEKLP